VSSGLCDVFELSWSSMVWQSNPNSTHLEARNLTVPGGKALRVLSSHTSGSSIRAAEYNRDGDVSS